MAWSGTSRESSSEKLFKTSSRWLPLEMRRYVKKPFPMIGSRPLNTAAAYSFMSHLELSPRITEFRNIVEKGTNAQVSGDLFSADEISEGVACSDCGKTSPYLKNSNTLDLECVVLSCQQSQVAEAEYMDDAPGWSDADDATEAIGRRK